jgi:RNA 2',3'-cyclic 3'-phosphodiesterase
MRAFIAIELEENVRNELSFIQESLKKTKADIKLIEAGNIHLTLRFLGEINENALTPIKKILEDSVVGENIFEISLDSLGAFPSLNTIKVIWVGVKEGLETLTNLAQKINTSLEKERFPKPDHKFSAHITLARMRSPLNKLKLQDFIAENLKIDLKQKIRRVSLFKSTLSSRGPIYERLYEVNFKNI